jgi:hypothetical protein
MTPTPPRRRPIEDLLAGRLSPFSYGDRFRRQRAGMLESPLEKLGRAPRPALDGRWPGRDPKGPTRNGNYRTRGPAPQKRWRA